MTGDNLTAMNSLRWVEPFQYQTGQPFRVMPLGEYKRGGRTLNITPDDLKAMAANYAAQRPRWAIPLYFGHPTEGNPDPPKVGNVKQLYFVDGDGLYAVPEFTPDGERAVADGAYQFVSPGVLWSKNGASYIDEHGKKFDNVIEHVALTNRPYFGASTALFSADDLDTFYSDDQPRGDDGKWGDGGGSSGGGDSGGSKSGGGSSGQSKAERDKAHSEFKFLDKRLAAGNLKKGERQSIEKRQEALAKIVMGVPDNASVNSESIDTFAITPDMLAHCRQMLDDMPEAERVAMQKEMAGMNATELEAHMQTMMETMSAAQSAGDKMTDNKSIPEKFMDMAGVSAMMDMLQKILALLGKDVEAETPEADPNAPPDPNAPQGMAAQPPAPAVPGYLGPPVPDKKRPPVPPPGIAMQNMPAKQGGYSQETPMTDSFTVTADEFAAAKAKADKVDAMTAELAAIKTQADTFAAELKTERKARRLDQLKDRAEKFMALPVKADELAEKFAALEEASPDLFHYFEGLLEAADKQAVQSGLFTQVASGRRETSIETFDGLTAKVLADKFAGDPAKYEQAMKEAAALRPDLVTAYIGVRE